MFVSYNICEKCYKPIAVQRYIDNCISQLPRLTLLAYKKIELMNMPQHRACLYVEGLTVFISLLSTWYNLSHLKYCLVACIPQRTCGTFHTIQ